ncbi:HpcH/HpaI aldolase/citrate lyase domain containing protein [Candidatus Nanopelagicaceae bacterium]
MKLIYITADPYEASIADQSFVDYVMVDLEVNGKSERQKGRDTLISHHTIHDVSLIRKVLTNSKLLVRINPIWENTEEEIELAISFGADSLMLPMFRAKEEVQTFLSMVNGRAECQLLLETSTALENIDSILGLEGISTVHVGLNDLHQELNLRFMFELFLGDLLDQLGKKVIARGIGYGIGGVGRPLVSQLVSPEHIIKEHIRLGSSQVILSRDFRKVFLDSKSEHLLQMEEACKQIRDFAQDSDNSQNERVLFRQKLVASISAALANFSPTHEA